MASKPTHVAVGDPDTATGQNNLMDWVGVPLQALAWSSSPVATPPAGSELSLMVGQASLTTNASGVGTVALPASFPGGLGWWFVVPTVAAITCQPTATGANSSTIAFTARNAAGAALASTAITVLWLAIGY